MSLPFQPPTPTAIPTELATATLAPTETPTPAPSATPTPDSAAMAQTQAAETRVAAAPIIEPQMQKYGLSTAQGSLGWMHRPITLSLTKYGEYQTAVDYPELRVADFVVQADITWSTTTGFAGCGFAVRASPGFGRKLEYNLLTVRLSGAPVWLFAFYKSGNWTNISGFRKAAKLNVKQGSTNTVAIVAQGSRFTTYVNGANAGSVTHTKVSEGAVGFLADQESGKTTCTFENAWLWVLKPGSGT
ncbi:MAG: hypothetical protein HY260_11525 [Chloroflexi bacterium]|nr:hypothetical protein [Chloroflexota bacterium]